MGLTKDFSLAFIPQLLNFLVVPLSGVQTWTVRYARQRRIYSMKDKDWHGHRLE